MNLSHLWNFNVFIAANRGVLQITHTKWQTTHIQNGKQCRSDETLLAVYSKTTLFEKGIDLGLHAGGKSKKSIMSQPLHDQAGYIINWIVKSFKCFSLHLLYGLKFIGPRAYVCVCMSVIASLPLCLVILKSRKHAYIILTPLNPIFIL